MHIWNRAHFAITELAEWNLNHHTIAKIPQSWLLFLSDNFSSLVSSRWWHSVIVAIKPSASLFIYTSVGVPHCVCLAPRPTASLLSLPSLSLLPSISHSLCLGFLRHWTHHNTGLSSLQLVHWIPPSLDIMGMMYLLSVRDFIWTKRHSVLL